MATLPTLKVRFDPNSAYRAFHPDQLMEACGLIPSFVIDAAHQDTAETVLAEMEKSYGFGLGWRAENVTLDDYGRWVSNDEDADLDPFVYMQTPTGVDVRIYPHALVIVSKDDEILATRMD